jgi:tRNA modification GTPase
VGRIACLTPPGKSALSTLACHGPGAWAIVRELFRPLSGSALPDSPLPGQFWLGRVGEDLADEAVLAVRCLVSTLRLELHCHGGREVVRHLRQVFQSRGLTLCDWQRFLAEAGDEPLRTAATVALTDTTTARTASIVLDQVHGAFGAALAAVVEDLDAGRIEAAGARLAKLARHAPLGRRLTEPWHVVLAGAPNVGKSSLLNALAGFQRSIVSPTPGTTRDVVTTRTAFDGWPVELADTAGRREATDALEGQGVGRACATAGAADLCLWVLDVSTAPVWPDPDVGPLRLVVNKTDLPPAWDLNSAGDALRVSARTGDGLSALCRSLADWLVPEPPAPGEAVPFTPQLASAVKSARRELQAGQPEQARERLRRVAAGAAEKPDTSLKTLPRRG